MKINGILRLAFVAAAAGSQVPAYRERDASDTERGESLFVQSLLETHVRGRGRYTYAPAPRRDQGAASGFRLVEDLGCREPGDDAVFCRAAVPKAWTPSEIEDMRRTLGELKGRPNLARFLVRVEAGGFTSVTRQREIVHWRQGEGWRRRYYPNSFHSNRDVVFADGFFRLASDERRWATLHLLAHTYDFSARHGETFLPVWSVHPRFLKRAGFTPRSDGRWDYRGMPPSTPR